MTVEPNDRNLALAINAAAYDERDESRVVAGSPHLKYASLKKLYESLVHEITADRPTSLSVLELGAGDGLGTTPWFATTARVIAVDCSEKMLARLAGRALASGSDVKTVLSDAETFIATTADRFDVVCFVSMLHHVPDYLALLRNASKIVNPGGCFLTFQDPLRYDALPLFVHQFDRMSYFAWRLGQGNLKRGIKTRLRRLRGVYSPNEGVDYEEYHVVRNGVDSEEIIRQLRVEFEDVRKVTYWSSLGSFWQASGEHLGLRNTFGVLAKGRR